MRNEQVYAEMIGEYLNEIQNARNTSIKPALQSDLHISKYVVDSKRATCEWRVFH